MYDDERFPDSFDADATSDAPRRRGCLFVGVTLLIIVTLLGSSLAGIILAFWRSFARRADGTLLFPVSIGTQLLLLAALLATATGLLAAILPALRAARLDPVVAIRG